MMLFRKKVQFEKALAILSKDGFTKEYTEMLKSEIAEAKHPADIAKGKSFLANALLVQGDLTEAYKVFEEINMKKLEAHLRGNLVSNMIFCLYVQDKFKQAEELYITYNAAVLREYSDASRRSLAIHQHINGQYEAAIEIMLKMIYVWSRRCSDLICLSERQNLRPVLTGMRTAASLPRRYTS